jgi:hypothetical protein
MKSISFKNFRRFADFPQFQFSDITILVGGNNAGKSTLVKGLVLLIDNIRQLKILNDPYRPMFCFDVNNIHDLNLGTFRRTLNAKADSGMNVTTQIDRFKYSFDINAYDNNYDSPMAIISTITVEDSERGITLGFNPDWMSICVDKPSSDDRPIIVRAPLLNYIDNFAGNDHSIPHNVIARMIYQWVVYQSAPVDALQALIDANPRDGFTTEEQASNRAVLSPLIAEIAEIAHSVNDSIYSLYEKDGVYYIQARSVMPRVHYSIDNAGDYLARVLHRYSRENVDNDSEARQFLCRWLSLLDIGQDYRITAIGGESYTMEIETAPGIWQHLADLGMGANQLTTLLLELATLVSIKSADQHPLIIIEEPEQNLHPKTQSHLADLFDELNGQHGFKFLIETHSEYLIRRTQVLVAEMEAHDIDELQRINPFKVYYFPAQGMPYDMQYQLNGHFVESFGDGFFDEAGKWTRQLTRNRRK